MGYRSVLFENWFCSAHLVWFCIGNCIGMIVIGIGYGISNDIEFGIATGTGIGLLLANLVLKWCY